MTERPAKTAPFGPLGLWPPTAGQLAESVMGDDLRSQRREHGLDVRRMKAGSA